MQFKHKVLDNGLEIVAEVNPDALSVSLGYFVKVGARHETAPISGVSHFLEHMQFKGTPKRSAEQVNREIDELGGHSNAYTCEDHTVYYLHVIPEYQNQAVDLLTDIMRPSLRSDDFETEKQVIIEEIAMYDDQPPYGAFELSMEQFYGSHPLSNRVLGTAESVTGLTSETMRSFHEQRYAPNNVLFVATGAIDFDALVDQLTQLTSAWKRAELPIQTKFNPERNDAFRELAVPTATQQYVIGLQSGPSRHTPDRHANRLAASAIGDENGSRLFWALIDSGLAETASLFTQQFDDCGNVGFLLCCAPQDAQKNWDTALQILKSVETEPLSQRELELVRNRMCASIILSAERPSSRLFSVGSSWMSRSKYESLSETIAKYTNVTLDQINEAAYKIAAGSMSITSVGPSDGALTPS